MANEVVVILTAMAVVAANGAAAKGDPAAGQVRAAVCTACHGATGISADDAWPNLAGQGYGYLVRQLKSFRDGARKSPVMETLAKPLSDEDIENLAAFFSTQKGSWQK